MDRQLLRRLSIKSAICVLFLGVLSIPLYSAVQNNAVVTQNEKSVGKEVISDTNGVIGKSVTSPILREDPGQPAPQELISKILEANKFWLHPDVKHLSYTFSMKHTNADDLWKATVKFTGPDQLTVIPVNGEKFEGKVDDTYDPDNNAYPPILTTILQGVTFFGPMHQFRMVPEEHTLFVVGEESFKGNNVYIIHLKPKPERRLSMRVGCGIGKWKGWYGYSGRGVSVDQFWVDRKTGMVLREEGFSKDGKCSFVIEYDEIGGFFDGKRVKRAPGRVIVTLLGKETHYPWVFDMKFTIYVHGETVWGLKRLEEFQDTKEPVAIAEVFDVTLKSNSVKKDFTEEKTRLHNEQRKITAEDIWARLINVTKDIRQANFGGYSGVWLKLRREEGYVVKWKSIYEIFFAKELDYFPIYGRVTNSEDKKGADWKVLGTKRCGNEGIIIPTRIEGTEYNEEGKAWQVTIFEIDPKSLRVNYEVNDDIFTIQAPQDVKYVDLDAKLGKEIDYRQKENNSGVKKAPDEILMEMSSEERKIFGKIAGGDIRIVEIAKSHLLREKPTMKQAQLGKSYIDFDLTHVPKLIKVPFLVVSGAAREEIEGETFRTIHTTYPTITVLMDFTGNLVSIEEGSMVTTHYHANRTSAENALIEFLRQGAEHATSLIRDARVHYVFKQDGWMYKEVNWAYQPGKEFLRFKIFRKNGELAGDNACYYDGQKTAVFLYPMGNRSEKPSASISSGESIFKLKTIPQYPPTTLFLRFWPVGITLDQILSNEGTILLPKKEFVDKSQCYVIDLKSVGGDYEDLGYKIWLDSERGFLPRRIEIWKEGKVRIAIGPIILDRFGENIWFPVRAEIKTYYEKVRETNIEMDQIKINEGLDESIFVPTFEPGMTVHDHQLDKSYTIPQP